MDVLLGLPVSRREVFLSESAATFTSVLIVLALAWLGNATAARPLRSRCPRRGAAKRSCW
jgi:hypothetical protein